MAKGVLKKVQDSLKNLVAGLNTSRDKQSSAGYYLPLMADADWSVIYRSSWLARKVVDIPAIDSTRKWREWQGDEDQIEKLKAEEKRLKIPQKVKLGLQQGRLFGGSGIYISIKNDDPELPLDLNKIKKGSIDFVTVLSKDILVPGDMDDDPLSDFYGKPKWYEVSSESEGIQRIHPSRLSIFIGNGLLTNNEVSAHQGWGDSVLMPAIEAVKNSDSIAANIGSLVYEAKVDVLQIPDLANIMADPDDRKDLIERVELSALLKGNNGMLVIDGEEEYSQKEFTFTGLVDINQQALQAVAGAADIPITRFLGQSPAGMNSTGEGDLKNYYDSISGMQTLVITPELFNLDEAIIRSALGDRPDDVFYEWSSLWQMTDEQKSKISKETADTIKTLSDSGLFNDEDLAEASVALLVDHSIFPSFEVGEAGEEEEEILVPVIDSTEPRSLYVSRKVLNASNIIAWAKSQGIKGLLAAEDLHVTIIFSRDSVDWLDMGRDWSSDKEGKRTIPAGGPRVMETFDNQSKVLAFSDSDLVYRHKSMVRKGASWDWDDYTPHITIAKGFMPADVEPYQGPIVLGPELFEEIKEQQT